MMMRAQFRRCLYIDDNKHDASELCFSVVEVLDRSISKWVKRIALLDSASNIFIGKRRLGIDGPPVSSTNVTGVGDHATRFGPSTTWTIRIPVIDGDSGTRVFKVHGFGQRVDTLTHREIDTSYDILIPWGAIVAMNVDMNAIIRECRRGATCPTVFRVEPAPDPSADGEPTAHASVASSAPFEHAPPVPPVMPHAPQAGCGPPPARQAP